MNDEELNQLLQAGPSEASWVRIVAAVEAAREDEDTWAAFEAEALPKLVARVGEWPRALSRLAPPSWVERLCSAWDSTWEPEQGELPDLAHFVGLDLPGYDTFDGLDDEPRGLGQAPELALANALALGGKRQALGEGFEPLDALGHGLLRDWAGAGRIREVRYEVDWDEYAPTPLVYQPMLWRVLSGPCWRGLEALTLGWLNAETLPVTLDVRLRALTLIDQDEDGFAYDPARQLPLLAGSPCLASVEVLSLGKMPWSRALFDVLLDELEWQALRELQIVGLRAFHLEDRGQRLGDLIAMITDRAPTSPLTLSLVDPREFEEEDLASAAATDAPGWTVHISRS